MKFTKNRLLSLLLVLAMLFALATTAFATAGTVTFTTAPASTMTVGSTVTVVATCSASPAEGAAHVISYSVPTSQTALSIDPTTGVLRAEHVSTEAIAVTATCTTCNDGAAKVSSNGTSVTAATITLDDADKTASIKVPVESDQASVTAQLETELKNTWTDVEKAQLQLSTWTIESGKDYNTVSKVADSQLSFTANVTSKSDDYTLTGSPVAVTGTVTFKSAATFSIVNQVNGADSTTSILACKEGDSNQTIGVRVKDLVPDTATPTYQWYKSSIASSTYNSNYTAIETNGSSATYAPNVATAGKTYYICKVTETTTDGIKSEKYSSPITVDVKPEYRVVLTPSTYSSYVNSSVTYTAKVQKYTGTGTDGYSDAALTDYDGITYSASAFTTGGYASISPSYTGSKTTKATTTYVNLYGVSASSYSSKVTVTATAWKNNVEIGSGQHDSVTFYPVTTSDVLIQPTTANVAYMNEDALISAVRNAYSSTATPYMMKFMTNCGTFNYSPAYTSYYTTSSSSYKVNSTTFTPGTYYANFVNNPTATFYVYDSTNNYIVAKGTIKFGATASISYNAVASTPVFFKTTDFQSFFKTAVGNSTYASLSTVTFGTPYIASGSGTLGTLSYNGYSYSSYLTNVLASNLGYVSYTPSSSATIYTVSIPFTATGTYSYNNYATQTVSGTVTIKVNDGHVITMVGTDFKSASIWSDITSKHPGVSYVSFSQPQSTVGKLYYGYSSIASKGSLVSYTDRFNNSNYNYSYANTIKSIDGIYFVPAADCLDTVTLTYTAYTSATATTGVSDTITFTITKKTASSIFNDVTASNTGKWSADAIDFLARNSIVEGGSYGTFNPNGNMTRGDFVLMLYRLAGKPSVSGISNPFTDVKSSDYYYNAILWAYRNDIVTGVDAKTFAPKKNITREQIAATLYRMAGSPSTSGYLTGYYDYAKIHSYATNAMRWAISNGVITGSNGYLTPTNNATRAQVATMLHRYLTK